ncbi:MAG: FtsX-like permease family protein, partial [Candidatus Bathyarchaeia archaeon]
RILRFIGASRKILVRDLTLKIAPISLLASALGTTLAASLLGYILESGLLQILSHSIQIYLDTYTIILITLSILAITLLGIRTATK